MSSRFKRILATVTAFTAFGAVLLPGSVALAGSPTSIAASLSNPAVEADTTLDFSVDLPAGGVGDNEHIDLALPNFVITGGPSVWFTCTGGGIERTYRNDALDTLVIFPDVDGCSGHLTVTGLPITNPAINGTYTGTIDSTEPGFTPADFDVEITSTHPTDISDTLAGYNINETTTHAVDMKLPTGGLAPNSYLYAHLPDFNIHGVATVTCTGTGSASYSSNSGGVLAIRAGGVGCDGRLTVSGFTGTNPATVGSYPISITSDSPGFVSATSYVEVAAPPTAVSDTLSTYQAGVSATHSISMVLPAGGLTSGHAIILSYPDFAIFQDNSITAGCTVGDQLSIDNQDGHNVFLLAGATGCFGTLTFNGLGGTNPDTAGSHLMMVSSDQIGLGTALVNFDIGNSPTDITDTLSNSFMGVTSTHAISLTLPPSGLTAGHTLTLAYPDFTIDSSGVTASCSSGGFSAFSDNGHNLTLTAGSSGCRGTVTINGLSGTNPGTAGTYTATVSGNQPYLLSADFSVDVTSSAPTLQNDLLSSYKHGVTATQGMTINLPIGGLTAGHTLTLAYPDFAISSSNVRVMCSIGDITAFSDNGHNLTLTAGSSGCVGRVYIDNLSGVNPDAIGIYTVTMSTNQPNLTTGHFTLDIIETHPMTAVIDTMSSRVISTSTTHSISLVLPGDGLAPGTPMFFEPVGFTFSGTPVATCDTGGFSYTQEHGSSVVLVAGDAGCTGTVTVNGLTSVNPSDGGTYSIGITTYQPAIDNGEFNFTTTSPPGSSTTVNHVAISRYKVDAIVTADINYRLIDTLDGTLTITFPAGFTVLSAATGGSSCLDTFGFTASTLTAQKHGCTGNITLTGATVRNPHDPGVYIVSWINDIPGNSAIYITQEDQVSITASVNPVLTFNVGTQDATAANCDGTFSGNGGTLALGTLGTGAITSSDVAGIQHICTRVTTNATHGAVVTVKSANASLKSISVGGDAIPSASADMAVGTANYGMCAGARHGQDLTDPVGGVMSKDSPFDGTCADDTSAGHVGGLTTGAQAVWSIDAPTQNAYQNLVLKAAISPTTKAHSDYVDTLTFVATGTF